MARKRLTPVPSPAKSPPEAPCEPSRGAPETKAFGLARTFTRERPPIARVAGESAAEAALSELAGEFAAARSEGRLVQALPLDAIEIDHLVRDRMSVDDAEMTALKDSLAARGQQTPIEVVALEGGRYGLISGWRRVAALQALLDETGEDRFGRVQALLRRPDSAAEAYEAMVEENEIRVGLSYYERARIAAKAAGQGVYDSPATAIRALFAHGSRARRSKIGAFLTLYEALDAHLRFPAAIPERLGLALARGLGDDPALAARLRDRLRKAPAGDAEAEQAALQAALAAPKAAARRPSPAADELAPGIRLAARRGGLTLSGPGVDAAFRARLEAWLRD